MMLLDEIMFKIFKTDIFLLSFIYKFKSKKLSRILGMHISFATCEA